MADADALRRQLDAATAELARLRGLMDALQGVYLFQQRLPAGGGPRTFCFASAPLTRDFGVAAGDPANLIARAHPDDVPRLQAAIDAAVRDRTSTRLEARLRDPGGRLRWFLFTAQVGGEEPDGAVVWNGALVDITDRKDVEERHELTLRASNDGLWDWDPATGQVVSSDKLVELMGVESKAALSTFDSFVERHHPDDRARVLRVIEDHLRARAPFDLEFRMRTGTTTSAWRWFRSRGQAAWDAEGRPTRVAGSLADVTQRREAEEALRESEQRFALLAHASFEAIVLTERGVILDANDETGRLLGFDPRTLPGRRADDFVAPAWRERVQAAMRSDDEGPYEHELIHADGRFVTVEARARTLPYQGRTVRVTALRDVTTQRAAQAALRASEAKYRDLYMRSPALLHSIDPEGRLISVSDRWLETFGYAREEVLGRPSVDFLTPESRRYAREEVLPAFFKDGVCNDVHYQYVRKDGQVIDVLLSAIAERDPTGRMIRSMAVLVVVTERLRAEAALRRSEASYRALNAALERRVEERTAELAASNKELEAFSYAVSHDLRAPLRAINGFARALQEESGPKLDAEGHDHLRRVLAGSERMGRLIDDLLGLSRVVRRGDFDRVPVDIGALARAAIDELRRLHPDRQATLDVEPGLVVEADPGLLRALVVNLVDNAWKFTGRRPTARISVGARVERGRRVFFVRDDGAGFDPALAHRLFTPFQRLHSPKDFEGNGIGLATVQRIARRHGGDVWAEGVVDQGATFFFALSPPALATPDATPSPGAPAV